MTEAYSKSLTRPPLIQQHQILSRGTVYASLQSYDNDNVHEQQSRNNNYTTSKEDTKLLSFYTNISYEFHRTLPRLDNKNTSGRPLSLADITSRVSQRALTLKGDYNSTVVGNKKKNIIIKRKKIKKKKQLGNNNDDDSCIKLSAGASFNISTEQRKRKRNNILQRILGSTRNSHLDPDDCSNDILHRQNIHFLIQFNCEWNLYMQQLLELEHYYTMNEDDRNQKLTTTMQRVKALSDQNIIEWVGAFVQVNTQKSMIRQHDKDERNGQSSNVTTIDGILISHTPYCWIIVPLTSICCTSNTINTVAGYGDTATVDSLTSNGDVIPKQLQADHTGVNKTTWQHHLPIKVPKQRRTSSGHQKSNREVVNTRSESNTSSIITVRIPLQSRPQGTISNTTTASQSFVQFHDQTEFLNIHLQ